MNILQLRNRHTIKILSIDGGGIRGIIPAAILVDLERRLHALNKKKPFAELFDLMAGTSTGGLITLSLAKPLIKGNGSKNGPEHRADLILNMYLDRGKEIFPLSKFTTLRNLKHAFNDKYSPEPLEDILYGMFGDVTIHEGLTNLLVTSYDTVRRSPIFFKNCLVREKNRELPNFYMRDAARATSAAPTYYEPARIFPVSLPSSSVDIDADIGGEESFTLIDGGVFANNPAMCAYIEARKLFPKAKKFVILSLGTGAGSRVFGFDELKHWGYIDWVRPDHGAPLSSIMSQGQSECVNHQLKKLPGVDYIRINDFLAGCSVDMDDASDKNIEGLIAMSEKLARKYNRELDYIARLL